MPVTIDVSPAVHARAGLGRYAAQLAVALDRERPGEVQLFANLPSGSSARQLPDPLQSLPMKSVSLGYKPWRMAVWLGQLAHASLDERLGETALYHATEHLLMPLKRIPAVLTVHDLIFKLFPEHHKKLNYLYLNTAMPLFVRRASHIIAVSEQTKRDLVSRYETPHEKISVVYEAAASNFKPLADSTVQSAKAKYNLPNQYIVTVGTIEPRKNLARLVEALTILRHEFADLKLVVIGSKGWLANSFYEAIDKLQLHDAIIQPGFVPDDDLPAVMCGAVALVSASLYEGFGLPVLEAMACGVPVACSRTSSLGEIAGEAALTFDPESVEDMAAAIKRLIEDPSLRAHQRDKGLKRAAQFSWGRAAKETWAIYDQTIQSWRSGRAR